MVRIHSISASDPETHQALAEIDKQIASFGPTSPSFIYAFYGCSHDDRQLHRFLSARFPDAALLGGTSCAGIMDKTRLWGTHSIGLLLIEDPDGSYGVASAPVGDDAEATAERLLRSALVDAGCPGELPELIWIYQVPGREEAVIAGLRRVVGDRCPVIGGSSADDAVAGQWRQLGRDGVLTDGLVVGVLFPSGGIGYAFQGGYEPAGPSGIVTRIAPQAVAAGRKASSRTVMSIDHQPAARVYNEWTGHSLNGKIDCGGNVLLETTMFPIAVDAGHVDGVPHFRLIHPESITTDGALCTFAELEEGSRVYSMRGDRKRLIERAGRVAHEAISMLPADSQGVAGGLIIYCAGCMLAVGDEMPEVTGEVRRKFADAPFLGCFTFGEQGRMVDRNVHGNLMISAIAFGH